MEALDRDEREFYLPAAMSGGAAEAWTWPASLDALVVTPGTHRLLFENDAVRVLETRLAPGDATEVHTHRWAGVLCVLSFDHFGVELKTG